MYLTDIDASLSIDCIGQGGFYNMVIESSTRNVTEEKFSFYCDLGAMDIGSDRKEVFFLRNRGTFDLFITSISSVDEFVDIKLCDRMEKLSESLETDWDEYDYRFTSFNALKSKHSLLIDTKSRSLANSLHRLNRNVSMDLKDKSPKSFIGIPPGGFIQLVVSIKPQKIGVIKAHVKIDLENKTDTKITHELSLVINAQPKLIPNESNIDFGIKGVHTKSVIKFSHIFDLLDFKNQIFQQRNCRHEVVPQMS